MNTTHTAEVHAWLSSYNSIEGLFDSKSDRVIAALAYSNIGPGSDSYFEREGYTYIGKATITVTVGAPNDVIASKVESLKAQQKSVRAKAQKTVTELDQQIQKLLAISFDGAVS